MEIRRKPERPWEQYPVLLDRMKALRLTGISTASIAKLLNAEFGTSLTKNAVCGRIGREGLAKTSSNDGHIRSSRKVNPYLPRPKEERTVTEAPEPLRIPLLQAKTGQCRAPAAEDGSGHAICGLPTDRIYCDYHSKIFYQPPQPHRRAAG